MLWSDSKRGEIRKKRALRPNIFKNKCSRETVISDGWTEPTNQPTNKWLCRFWLFAVANHLKTAKITNTLLSWSERDDVAVISNCFDLTINQRLPLFNWCCCFWCNDHILYDSQRTKRTDQRAFSCNHFSLDSFDGNHSTQCDYHEISDRRFSILRKWICSARKSPI